MDDVVGVARPIDELGSRSGEVLASDVMAFLEELTAQSAPPAGGGGGSATVLAAAATSETVPQQ